MASIRKEIPLEVSAEHVWSVVRDVGALHTRLVPGFVVDTRLEPDARVVTFGNGMVVRELIVDLDDALGGWPGPPAAVGSATTTPRCRCSPRATAAAGWSGSPTCCRMSSRAIFA